MKSILFLTLLCAALAFAGCSGSTPPVDTPTAANKPSVQIVAPPYGASFVEGEIVAVQSVAADASGVMRVELYVDGQLAHTQLAPGPQGEKQFSVVQEWVAAMLGAHTLIVRAFNTAEVAGEATIPIAVNPRIAVQNTPLVPTDAVQTPTPPAVIVTVTPLAALTTAPPIENPPTAVLPTEQPPTAAPPTARPPTATPTIPPIVFLPPFDGGMSVSVDWSENGLQIEAQANDTVVGGDNGEGIAFIEFFIQELDGDVIATKRENTKPYCYFGEQDGECVYAQQDSDSFRWSDSRPIQPGWYFIRAVAHTPTNRIQVAERPVRINFPPDSFENLFVNIVEPQTDRPENELVFQAEVSGAGSGAGIDRVEMFVVAYDGKIVHARAERTPNFCAFSGGDNDTPCPPYNFAQNGLKWSSGAPVNPTQYILRAVAYALDGQITASTFIIQIDIVN